MCHIENSSNISCVCDTVTKKSSNILILDFRVYFFCDRLSYTYIHVRHSIRVCKCVSVSYFFTAVNSHCVPV